MVHKSSERDSQRRKDLGLNLPMFTLTSAFSNTEPASVPQPGRENHDASVSHVLVFWRFSMEPGEQFSTKLGLDKGEYRRCTQREYHHVLFKFFFIFLHTGKSSKGA